MKDLTAEWLDKAQEDDSVASGLMRRRPAAGAAKSKELRL